MRVVTYSNTALWDLPRKLAYIRYIVVPQNLVYIHTDRGTIKKKFKEKIGTTLEVKLPCWSVRTLILGRCNVLHYGSI